jgi:hypothetical protein
MNRNADEVIRECEALLARCNAESLRDHAHATWRTIQRDAEDRAAIVNALPCQDYGVEEVDV